MIRKNGKIKNEYKHLAEKVTIDLKDLVRYLLKDQKLTQEEVIGMVTSATVLLVSQETCRDKIARK